MLLFSHLAQGLGQAMAYEFAKHGQKVVVNFFPGLQESAQETVEEIVKLGGDAIAIPADCTHPEQIRAMFAQAIDHFGAVDVVVNNAGITKDHLVGK
jgi:3-oxoacyl-[acyl-carrier protein] reductase